MDVVLQALDSINSMFAQVRDGEEPTPAAPALLEALSALAQPAQQVVAAPAAPAAPVVATVAEPVLEADGDITDDEFELLLEALHVGPEAGEAPAAADGHADGDEITDDEFEALLDQLHGTGKGPGSQPTAVPSVPATPVAGDEDLITDDEFESLLDELHGPGRGPGAAATPTPVSSPAPAAPEPEKPQPPAPPAAEEKPAPKPAPRRSEAGADHGAAAETTVRVDTARLDEIMNMVGELVLVRNRLTRLGLTSEDEELTKAVAMLDVVTADLQASVMKTRMQPIKKVFGRFPRVVRDLSRSLKKEINLELVGEETDLDKNLVEALADPLVHLVRNSVDHGIELPDVREANGKPRQGQVVLAAEQEGDHILLSITDDGAGMDASKLRQIAVNRGLYDQDGVQRLTDEEVFALIFAPGFSTKVEVSDVSGRGVGMDVVKTKISQLNGSIEIQSTMGKGTRINIKVPLTLAIMPTLMVMLANQTFALPLVSVNEIFHMNLRKSHVVDGQECVAIRDQAIPIFYLKNWLIRSEER